jgi:hypothetical protein
VVAACQGIQDGQAELLDTFINDGPSTETVRLVDPIIGELDGLASDLADVPGSGALRNSVGFYRRTYEWLRVLYAEGETAYQSVPASEQEDTLLPLAEAAWEEGAAALFGADAPPPPSGIDRC